MKLTIPLCRTLIRAKVYFTLGERRIHEVTITPTDTTTV